MKQQKNIFEYDDCGNMTYEHMRGNGIGESTTEVFYTYDELHRVISAKENYGNAWRNYVYDRSKRFKRKYFGNYKRTLIRKAEIICSYCKK